MVAATQQVIHNGPRNLVLKYTLGGDSGDVTNNILFDATSLDSGIASGGLRLDKIDWALTGFSCKLGWKGAPDVDLVQLAQGGGSLNFSETGGIVNNATAQTGEVTYTTTDYGASGEGGHIVLSFKKKSGTALSFIRSASDSLAATGQDIDGVTVA